MTTITVWLLLSIGLNGERTASPTQVVERFKTVEACEFVANSVRESRTRDKAVVRCVQATVVKP
jgi:hypothetical protein